MRQSQLFSKTKKEFPKDETSKNAQLLIRAGYVYKEMAGVYSFLPLGLRVLNKVVQIIREEMNAIGGQELSLTALQDKSLWQMTDRWDDAKVDNWFKTALKNGTETGLAITHEEPLTRIMTRFISSYRDLPVFAYQFQTKFRNETRAKSGVMRGREFLMKDLYSFSRNEAEHKEMYEKAKQAYKRIFARLGIGEVTHVTFASGGIFSKFSEEFQTESEAGEDLVYVDEKTGIAVNKEVYTDEVLAELGLKKDDLKEKKTIEVGNIFNLGTKFSEPIGLSYRDEQGQELPVVMGSYGIGPSRIVGTLVEVLSDDKGIVWPESVAPYKVHLISLGADEEAEKAYEALTAAGIETLYDDRDLRAGEKFADSELIGIPYRVVIGQRSKENGQAEVKKRTGNDVENVALESLVAYFKK